MSAPAQSVVSFGEILFDRFPDGDKLGGAALNFAWYVRQLGVPVSMISAVGRDSLGEQVRETLSAAGIDQTHVTSRREPTGVVQVTLTDGQPEYEILEAVAWDHIEVPASMRFHGTVLYYGSLAQRTPVNRQSLAHLFTQPFPCRLFDVNIRKPFNSASAIQNGLAHATHLKMNEEEWPPIAQMTGLQRVSELCEHYDIEAVALTRGAQGAELHTAREVCREPGRKARVVDAVGAGDAFSAVIAVALTKGIPLNKALPVACELGAFVVSHRGAQVEVPDSIRQALG